MSRESAARFRLAPPERPLPSYCVMLAVFGTGLFGALAAIKRSGHKLPDRVAWDDLALLGLATHRLSQAVAKDRVTAPLRAPFTEPSEQRGAIRDRPVGSGMQRSLGQLITCEFCMSPWISTALLSAMSLKPRETRFVASVFALTTLSDVTRKAVAVLEKSPRPR